MYVNNFQYHYTKKTVFTIISVVLNTFISHYLCIISIIFVYNFYPIHCFLYVLHNYRFYFRSTICIDIFKIFFNSYVYI